VHQRLLAPPESEAIAPLRARVRTLERAQQRTQGFILSALWLLTGFVLGALLIHWFVQ